MGEEMKEEKKKEEKQEEKKDAVEESPQEIVLKVDMHCEACARKVARSLKGFHGVEGVMTDYKGSKVVVKGKEADPIKVQERIQKKSGKRVEIISSLPKPPEENKEEKKEEPPKEEKKEEPPAAITVVLSVRMHCEACAQALQKRVSKIKGVEAVTTDVANDKVTVKGVVDPDKLVHDVYKKTGKHATVVKEEEKKKDGEKKDEEKKEEKLEEKKEEDDIKADIRRSEYWAPRYYVDHAHAHAPQMFSDENPNACFVM